MRISREKLQPTAPNHVRALTEKTRSAQAKSTTTADWDNQYYSSGLSLRLVGFVRINQDSEDKNLPWAELGTEKQRK